ncbi:secreted protein [Moniliophthora roreri]|uniref:Secreted protein n=1 Tax=Moniliophthora roreri TaxID=221103 RepID=A0A0W0EZN6_MONRR|nr:secreted protein [Moniliophthora roreri]
MKAIAIPLAALSLLAGALAQVTLNTPSNPVVCQPLQLTWTGGQAPYFISVQDGNNPSGPALFQFPEQNGTALTWEVNYQAGTSIGFLLRDSNGATSQTAAVTVQPGISTSCVGQSPSISGGGANTGGTGQPTSTGAGSTAAPTGGSAGSTPTTSGGSNRPTTTSSQTSGPANTSNAASATGAQMGAAGLIGAALLALLA